MKRWSVVLSWEVNPAQWIWKPTYIRHSNWGKQFWFLGFGLLAVDNGK